MGDNNNIYCEIRLHGRGGQGVVSAAALLALSAFDKGFQSQAFPKFGSERRGSPVEAYVRISSKAIRTHTQIRSPDVVIVQDVSLFESANILEGLKPKGVIIVNSPYPIDTTKLSYDDSIRWIFLPATEIAQKHIGRPLPNTALLGAFSAVLSYVDLDTLKASIADYLKNKGDKVIQSNIKALEEGFSVVGQQ